MYFKASFSKLYGIRGLSLIRFFTLSFIPLETKVLLKTLMNFSSYIIQYLVIMLLYLLVLTPFTMEYFKPEAFISEKTRENSTLDKYVQYLMVNLRIFFSSEMSDVGHGNQDNDALSEAVRGLGCHLLFSDRYLLQIHPGKLFHKLLHLHLLRSMHGTLERTHFEDYHVRNREVHLPEERSHQEVCLLCRHRKRLN